MQAKEKSKFVHSFLHLHLTSKMNIFPVSLGAEAILHPLQRWVPDARVHSTVPELGCLPPLPQERVVHLQAPGVLLQNVKKSILLMCESLPPFPVTGNRRKPLRYTFRERILLETFPDALKAVTSRGKV